jgi:hypothetical protein
MLRCFLGCLLAVSHSCAKGSERPQLKTASSHPIQYYLSLPDGWTAGKKWPVVVVIESPDREFLEATSLSSRHDSIDHSS